MTHICNGRNERSPRDTTEDASVNFPSSLRKRPKLNLVPFRKWETRLRALFILCVEGEPFIVIESKLMPRNVVCWLWVKQLFSRFTVSPRWVSSKSVAATNLWKFRWASEMPNGSMQKKWPTPRRG